MADIGIMVSLSHIVGRVSLLENDFRELVELGCVAAEIPVLGVDAIVGGRLIQSKVDLLRQIAGKFDLRYSVHAPNNLNLANPRSGDDGRPNMEREMAIFIACIELTRAIGGEVLVYHCGVNTVKEDEEAREREVCALRELASVAEKNGVMVGVENIDGGTGHVVQQLEAVGADSVRMTLDLGHLFLAAQTLGLDFLQEIRQAASWICHVHHHDNQGIQGKADAYPVRIVFGETDLHLPLGWGTIPHAEALAALGDYKGLWILEVNERFRDHWSECLAAMQTYVIEAEQLKKEKTK